MKENCITKMYLSNEISIFFRADWRRRAFGGPLGHTLGLLWRFQGMLVHDLKFGIFKGKIAFKGKVLWVCSRAMHLAFKALKASLGFTLLERFLSSGASNSFLSLFSVTDRPYTWCV